MAPVPAPESLALATVSSDSDLAPAQVSSVPVPVSSALASISLLPARAWPLGFLLNPGSVDRQPAEDDPLTRLSCPSWHPQSLSDCAVPSWRGGSLDFVASSTQLLLPSFWLYFITLICLMFFTLVSSAPESIYSIVFSIPLASSFCFALALFSPCSCFSYDFVLVAISFCILPVFLSFLEFRYIHKVCIIVELLLPPALLHLGPHNTTPQFMSCCFIRGLMTIKVILR